MNEISRRVNTTIVKSEGTAGKAVAGGMVLAGGSTLALSTVAMFLPGGVFLWALLFVVFGAGYFIVKD